MRDVLVCGEEAPRGVGIIAVPDEQRQYLWQAQKRRMLKHAPVRWAKLRIYSVSTDAV